MEPEILSLVLPLLPGTEEMTRERIRARSDLGWLDRDRRWMLPRYDDPAKGPDTGSRLGDLDYRAFPGLHCCAFIVLDGDSKPAFWSNRTKQLHPYLIFEATVDGPVQDFVRDLVDHVGDHLIEIMQTCEGLPDNAIRQPSLLVDFLLRKRVRHNTYFSGVPGKSVSEIQSEAELRGYLTRALQKIFFPAHPGETAPERPKARFRDIQRRLRNMVRNEPSLNLTEERPNAPWSLRYGATVMFMGGMLLVLAFVPIVCWVLASYGRGFDDVLREVYEILSSPIQTTAGLLTTVVLFWLAVRGIRISLTPEMRPRLDRAPWYLANTWFSCAQGILRLAIIVLGLAMILQYVGPDDPVNDTFFLWPILTWVGILIAGWVGLLGVKALRARPLRRLENGPFLLPASHLRKAWLRALVDTANLCHVFWYLLAACAGIAALNPIFGLFWSDWVADLTCVLKYAIAISLYLLAAAALLLAVKHGFLALAHLLQILEDRRSFSSAEKLAEHNIRRDHIWAREEHRTHLNQNHFASATLVKSWPRMLYLRLSLVLINLVARYWDNRGKLGGIPTIFSARWLLLDDGHRLVFMTNYVGAWDSYLGEFSDLNAYIGVNAIWTNTYLPLTEQQKAQLGTGGQDVGFPTSRFMLFGGACLEQPFKAYVRQSQVETLAWYGAYPHLSVPNIHDNARIREDLFRELSTDALDALFRRI